MHRVQVKAGTSESLNTPYFYFLLFVLLILDQFSKSWVSSHLPLGHSSPLFPPVLYFTLVHNKGGAFGLFPQNEKLLGITIVFVVILLFFVWKMRSAGKLVSASLGMVVAGAFGNLIDRARFGYVVDFIDFRVWPVFNLADAFLVAGTALLLVTLRRQPADALP